MCVTWWSMPPDLRDEGRLGEHGTFLRDLGVTDLQLQCELLLWGILNMQLVRGDFEREHVEGSK